MLLMMEQAVLMSLDRWANFYVIVGSSAGALTGLQFVVITLVAQAQVSSSMREIRAFGTPNVVHFCSALMISVLMNIPWLALPQLAISLGALSAAGFVYSLTVIRHAKKQTGYSPDAADLCWYVAIPVVSYVLVGVAAVLAWWNEGSSLFVIAGVSLLLLFTGIRNAWDTVTYVAVARSANARESGSRK